MDQRDLADIGVLGVLEEADSPMTIEGVQEALQHAFDRYWAYGHGVLDPAIDRLLDAQHITPEHTGRDAYRITDAGRHHLTSLLSQPLDDAQSAIELAQRHQLVVQFGFLHLLPEEEQAAFLDQITARLKDEGEMWEARREARMVADGGAVGYRNDLIDLSIRIIDEHLAWIQNLEPYDSHRK